MIVSAQTIPYNPQFNRINKIKSIERITNGMLKVGLTTNEAKLHYKKLRNELETLRGDWSQVPKHPYLDSSELKPYRSSVSYFPKACGNCFNLPAGSAECGYYGCDLNDLMKEVFGDK